LFAPQGLETIIATPSPLARESKRTKRASNFAGVSMPSPAAAQRRLNGGKRQALALDVDRDRGQQPSEPIFQRREALARGLRGGAFLLGTFHLRCGFKGSLTGLKLLDVRGHWTSLLL